MLGSTMNIRATPDKNQKFTMYSGCSLQRLRNLEKQQESNRIKNAEQMGCVLRERVMLKKHNTEREEKVLQTVQQNVSVKNRGYFCVTVLVKPWNRKGPKLERRKLKGIDEHKKNDGQSDKRQKNQCQNALPQGDPFCAKKVKKKR